MLLCKRCKVNQVFKDGSGYCAGCGRVLRVFEKTTVAREAEHLARQREKVEQHRPKPVELAPPREIVDRGVTLVAVWPVYPKAPPAVADERKDRLEGGF